MRRKIVPKKIYVSMLIDRQVVNDFDLCAVELKVSRAFLMKDILVSALAVKGGLVRAYQEAGQARAQRLIRYRRSTGGAVIVRRLGRLAKLKVARKG